MRPPVDGVLRQLALTLAAEVAPAVSESYVQKSTGLISMLLAFAAEEWDRAAERRVEENRELRALLRDAAAFVTEPGLAGRLREAGQSAEESLSMRSLDSANDALRALLIDLHSHVEGREDREARRIEAAIWRALVGSTRRRALSLAPF